MEADNEGGGREGDRDTATQRRQGGRQRAVRRVRVFELRDLFQTSPYSFRQARSYQFGSVMISSYQLRSVWIKLDQIKSDQIGWDLISHVKPWSRD